MVARILALVLLLAHPGTLSAQSLLLDALPRPSIEELWKRGEEAMRAGDSARALALFGEALALDESRGRSWNYVGGVRFAQGDWLTALRDFHRALELDPRDVRACNNIGTVYERLTQFARAEEYYLLAIRIDPAYPTSHRNLGVLYAERLGRPGDARAAWERFLELSPPGSDADDVRRELERLPN